MNTEIWNSSKMGGTGGALKALTKNLANQLTLNRTEMKRVVARVISERHGHGDVGDYNGHMFFVRPERVDLTEQITHSKEAFDEMVNQKNLKLKLKLQSQRNQMPSSRSHSRSQSRSPSKQKPKRSQTGVITDSQHRNPVESKTKLRSNKSKQRVKPKAAAAAATLACHSVAPATTTPVVAAPSTGRLKRPAKCVQVAPSKQKSSNKLNSLSKPKPKQVTGRPQAANPKRKLMLDKQPQAGAATSKASKVQRLNAGKAVAQKKHKSLPQVAHEAQSTTQPAQPTQPTEPTAAASKTKLKRRKSLKQLPQSKGRRIMKKKVWLEPWQDAKRLAQRRLKAGGATNRSWCHPYQFQGGAGATQRHNIDHNIKLNGRSKIRSRINHNKLPTSRSCKQTSRRLNHLRSQQQLEQHLEAEEAIDDPERLEAGTLLDYGLKRVCSVHSKRAKRRYKLSPRLEQLARPVIHGKPHPQPLPSRTQLRKTKKSKSRRHRLVVDSSLGSIAGLKGSSRSGLTPAKRHLTLAFMNKDSGGRSPRRSRTVLWR